MKTLESVDSNESMEFMRNLLFREIESASSTRNLSSVLDSIDRGEYILPDFQRKYCWNLEMCRKLLLSIISGKHIGGIFIWETKDRVKAKKIGDDNAEVSYGYTNKYLIDGQQRMVSITLSFQGKKYKNINFAYLKINLQATCLDELIVISKETSDTLIPFYEMRNTAELCSKIDPKYWAIINQLSARLNTYQITIYDFKSDLLEDAIFQFNMLNSGGKKMTVEDILLSKIYSKEFKLKNELNNLLKSVEKFGLSQKVVISSLTLILRNSYKGKCIISLEHDEVTAIWDQFCAYIKRTCDYLSSIGYAEMSNLPYVNCFIAINRVFYEKKITTLNNAQSDILKKYIFHSGVAGRYAHHMESNTARDSNKLIVAIETNKSFIEPIEINAKEIVQQGTGFPKKKNAFTKAVLWAMYQKSPLSFLNNDKILASGADYSGRYKPQLHHIFPKNFLKSTDSKYPTDHIVNITMIEADVNQRIISDKAPSVYFDELSLENQQINEACESHLIDLDIVRHDNYDYFFEDRLFKLKELIESILKS